MPRGEMGQEELRAVKENVNKEGMQMEEGEEGGAAVYVGTKEEVTKARQLVETEGRAPDLESYLILNKQILMTGKEAKEWSQIFEDESLDSFLVIGEGTMVVTGSLSESAVIYYKDKEGNLARIYLEPSKIAEFKQGLEKGMSKQVRETIVEKLQGWGFKFGKLFGRDISAIVMEKNIAAIRAKVLQIEKQKSKFSF